MSGQRTAAVVFFKGTQLLSDLPDIVAAAHAKGVPVIVDCAAQLPPRKNLTEVLATGADLAVFSGGKGLRGPQASGLIIGTPELVNACRLNSAPNGGPARGQKVGKEEIMGLVKAVELFVEMDEPALYAEWHTRIAVLKAAADGVPGVTASTGEHFDRPNAEFVFDADETSHSAASVREALAAGTPQIVAGGADKLVLDPHTLENGEDRIVAARVREILTRS
eukprot:COSAG02_NODE_9048_length_2350_cov_24.346068_2_plen_222_part_00